MIKKNNKILILLLAIAISMQFAYSANAIVPTAAEKKAVNKIIKRVDGFSEVFKLKLLDKFNGGFMCTNDIKLTVHLHKAGLDEATLETLIKNKILQPIYNKISSKLTVIESKLDTSNKQFQDYKSRTDKLLFANETIIKLKDDEIARLNKDIDSTIKLSKDLASMDNPEAKKALEKLQNGNYEYAIKVFDSIIADPIKLEEKKHAKVYFNAAEARYLSNKYQESYKYYLKAVDRDEDNYEYLSKAAWMSMYLIKKEALDLLEKKLAIEKNKLKNEEKTADTYNTIGQLYYKLGKYEKALEFYNKALDILDIKLKTIGEIHSDTAITILNIGTVYYQKKQYEHAYENIEKAINIFKQTLPADHPKIINAQSWLEDVKKEM